MSSPSRSVMMTLFILALLAITFSPIFSSAATYTQCSAVPAMIPDTFSVTYQPSTLQSGTVYFTYVEPTWDNWPQFDIRELGSNPFSSNFLVQYSNQNFEFVSASNTSLVASPSSTCTFSTPQSFTRDNSWTATIVKDSDNVEWLNLTFTQTGSLVCTIAAEQTNYQGSQQFSVAGTLAVRAYTCDESSVVNGTTTASIDATSKVAMPSLYSMESCQRLTVTIGIEGQLTTKQLTRISQYITDLSTATTSGVTPSTILHSYDLGDSYSHNSRTYYNNVISWCTFNGTLPSTIQLSTLFVDLNINNQLSDATYMISTSKIPSYCFDGVLDFGESDIDCGGTGLLNGCAPCVDTSQICNGNTDCVSGECTAHELAGRRCATINAATSSSLLLSVVVVTILATVSSLFM